MADIPQTLYVHRDPNEGDLRAHDHNSFGDEEYVHKDVLVAMRAERDALRARVNELRAALSKEPKP